MRHVPERLAQSALAGLLLLACSEGAKPTQPASHEVRPASAPAVSANVVPTSTAPVVACYKPGQALVYVIKVPGAPSQCGTSDVQFTINQGVQGPEGPVGQTGPKGDTGAQGPAGAGPLTGLSLHHQSVTLPSDGRMRFTCPDGKSVLNFGWDITINDTAKPSELRSMRPATDGTKLFWGILGAPGTTLQVYWTCADAVAGVAVI